MAYVIDLMTNPLEQPAGEFETFACRIDTMCGLQPRQCKHNLRDHVIGVATNCDYWKWLKCRSDTELEHIKDYNDEQGSQRKR